MVLRFPDCEDAVADLPRWDECHLARLAVQENSYSEEVAEAIAVQVTVEMSVGLAQDG